MTRPLSVTLDDRLRSLVSNDPKASRASWSKLLDALRAEKRENVYRIMMRWHAEGYAEARGWAIPYTRAKVFRQ